MLSAIKRLLGMGPEPYARKIAVTLFREGFDPKVLDDLRELGSFNPDSHIFTFCRSRRLKPCEAAAAIRLAAQRYYEMRFVAEKAGWPVKAQPHNGDAHWPPHEAYFLQLLGEAAELPPGA